MGGYQSEGWLGEETSSGRAAGALMRVCCTGKRRLLGRVKSHTQREREEQNRGETPDRSTHDVSRGRSGRTVFGPALPGDWKSEREVMVVRPWFPEGR